MPANSTSMSTPAQYFMAPCGCMFVFISHFDSLGQRRQFPDDSKPYFREFRDFRFAIDLRPPALGKSLILIGRLPANMHGTFGLLEDHLLPVRDARHGSTIGRAVDGELSDVKE